MKRTSIFSFVIPVSIVLLAACAPGIGATGVPNNTAIPTTVSSTAPSVTSPAAASTATNAVSPTSVTSTSETMDPNLACSGGKTSASLTPELTEGPYYKAGSPEQASLYQDGMPGTKLVITGYVYDSNCQPVANAWLDFWQADANGNYDNNGYTLRGHQFTDANGRFQLTTIVPGLYPGRTEHIHVKVQAPNGQLITSQLFFPGVTQNDSDGIYNPGLLLSIQETSQGLQGGYNFVVPAS